MPSSPNVLDRFTERVEDYVKYRPHYPKEVITFLQSAIGFDSSWRVADIGSGTGISTKLFLENGNPVLGVEPNGAMREAAESYLGEYKNFQSIDGTAEATSIESHSVDLAVAAQAFHWFEKQIAREEFRRILKPQGYAFLMWNARLTDSSPFLIEYEKMLLSYGTDYKEVNHRNVSEETLRAFFGNPDYFEQIFPNVQRLDFEGLRGRLTSSSYVPHEGEPNFEAMIEETRKLFDHYQQNGVVEIVYDCEVYLGRVQ